MPDLPKEVTIGFGPTGMHILDSEAFLRDGATKDCALISYGYADLYRWGGNASKFSVIIWSSAKVRHTLPHAATAVYDFTAQQRIHLRSSPLNRGRPREAEAQGRLKRLRARATPREAESLMTHED
eukprot:7391227-Prymnesium_polylepis.1